MPRLLVIDDRDQTIEMCHRHLAQFDYVTRCGRNVPCQVCDERDRGCTLKCAHDYAQAAQALSSQTTLPDLVVLDLHFALPEERLLPEDKSALPTKGPARAHALEDLRRRQGFLILERLRQTWPTLPVVLLTTTDGATPSRERVPPRPRATDGASQGGGGDPGFAGAPAGGRVQERVPPRPRATDGASQGGGGDPGFAGAPARGRVPALPRATAGASQGGGGDPGFAGAPEGGRVPALPRATDGASQGGGGDPGFAGAPAGGRVPPLLTDPLVYFCENEIVDSRSLAAEVTRALGARLDAQEGPVFWGTSPAMAELRRSMDALARSPLPVLVQGETGTGKSFIAEHVLHPRSGAKGPLVVTDLSTVPATLLPSHLFGARRGAYTGSTEDHPGVFEQAHGGTLFLDEIANLDLDLQRQLLLVLERGAVTRLGDIRARPAQPKLVAATNQDLDVLVREGRFRADLYMRLNPATRLRIPALRERREDLPELVRFAFLEALRSEALRPLTRDYLARFPTPEPFVEAASTVAFGRPNAAAARADAFSVFVARAALDSLCTYDWPGNHRELKLLAMNALVFALTQHLDVAARGATARAPAVLAIPEALVDRLLGAPRAPLKTARPARGNGGRRVEVEVAPLATFAEISADVERQYLRAIFYACDGDLEKMSVELFGAGATARRVHLRLNQLGLKLRELRKESA